MDFKKFWHQVNLSLHCIFHTNFEVLASLLSCVCASHIGKATAGLEFDKIYVVLLYTLGLLTAFIFLFANLMVSLCMM